MTIRITGHGETENALVPEHEVDWPFSFPPTVGMEVGWKDGNGVERYGKIADLVFDTRTGVVIAAADLT